MPEGESIYDVYLGAGKATGEYQASLYGIEDVWSGIESAREKAKWKSEQRERTIDTVSAGLELASQAYGGYQAKQEFEGYLGEVEGIKGPYERVGAEGKTWGKMSLWEKMWQTPKYKFGEEILGREDITIMAQMAKYGIDIETEHPITPTSPGGKYGTAGTGETITYRKPTVDVKIAAAKKDDVEKNVDETAKDITMLEESQKGDEDIVNVLLKEPKVSRVGPSGKYLATKTVNDMSKDQLVHASTKHENPLVQEAARMRLEKIRATTKEKVVTYESPDLTESTLTTEEEKFVPYDPGWTYDD